MVGRSKARERRGPEPLAGLGVFLEPQLGRIRGTTRVPALTKGAGRAMRRRYTRTKPAAAVRGLPRGMVGVCSV